MVPLRPIYVGIDDTDMPEVGGTGRVAREVAALLAHEHAVRGVTRHQLLMDPRIPCTRGNSCKVIHLVSGGLDLRHVADLVAPWVVERSIPGSDPGICVADARAATSDFGHRAQREVLTQPDACAAAAGFGAVLVPLGGTGGGVIGAAAGVALAAGGNDGRFVDLYGCREARGEVAVEGLSAFGIARALTPEGRPVTDGMVEVPERGLRPVLNGGGPALILVPAGTAGRWRPVDHHEPGHVPGRKKHA